MTTSGPENLISVYTIYPEIQDWGVRYYLQGLVQTSKVVLGSFLISEKYQRRCKGLQTEFISSGRTVRWLLTLHRDVGTYQDPCKQRNR